MAANNDEQGALPQVITPVRVLLLSGRAIEVSLDLSTARVADLKAAAAQAPPLGHGIAAHEQQLLCGSAEIPDDGRRTLLEVCPDLLLPDASVTLVRLELVPVEGLRLPAPPGFVSAFTLSCRVCFDHMDEHIPFLFHTDSNSLQSHGLTCDWGVHKGHLCFYVQTESEVGPHGRGIDGRGPGAGGGWVASPRKLVLGQWHEVVLKKQPRSLAIVVDGEESSCELPRHIATENFKLRPTREITVGMNFEGHDRLTGRVAAVRVEPWREEEALTAVPLDLMPLEGLRLPAPPGFVSGFTLSCRVCFDHMDGHIPFLFHTDSNSLQSHGLTRDWGANKGYLCFYVQTASEVGPCGRGIGGHGPGAGGGWIASPRKMVLGQWHEVVLKKRPRSLAIVVDGEEVVCELPRHIDTEQFELKPTREITVGQDADGGRRLTGRVASVRVEAWAADP